MFDSLWVSMKSFSVIIQIKDTEREYFPVVLFIMPYKVVNPYLTLNISIRPEVKPTLRSLDPSRHLCQLISLKRVVHYLPRDVHVNNTWTFWRLI